MKSDNYYFWKENIKEGEPLYQELCELENDREKMEDCFSSCLSFGTGGLRGIMGVGSNRMNVYTVEQATQGYCNYLKKMNKKISIVIGYDSRDNSKLFAETAAKVLIGNDISVWLYPKLMPTPAVSFAVRYLRCDGGIVITASHNPAEYNGYKVYGSDGGQITDKVAYNIQKEIDKVEIFKQIKRGKLDSSRLQYINKDVVNEYQKALSEAGMLKNEEKKITRLIYSPLHGTGIACVPRILFQHGFENVYIPIEQKMPDGKFPTCPRPNPEEKVALEIGIDWAKKYMADLVLATDPDCDRVGAAILHNGEYVLIDGNQMGILLLDFICKVRVMNHIMPIQPIVIKTIVTTPMAEKIIEHYGGEVINTLTGFKYIGEQIGILEKSKKEHQFILGFEESYGYLSGTFVRDKDAVNASLLISEMTEYYKRQGKTLLDVLEDLYKRYGTYISKLISLEFKGAKEKEKIQSIMRKWRSLNNLFIGNNSIVKIIDYEKDDTGLPRSNVLKICLEGGDELVVRPSGTEPKLKIYINVIAKNKKEAKLKIYEIEEWLKGLIE